MSDDRIPFAAVAPVALEILAYLQSHAADELQHPLCPSHLPSCPPERLFLAAIVRMQDAGLIMSEALLVGTGPEPQLLEPSITRRGQMVLTSGQPPFG